MFDRMLTMLKALVTFVWYLFLSVLIATVIERPLYEAVAVMALSVVSYLAVRDD